MDTILQVWLNADVIPIGNAEAVDVVQFTAECNAHLPTAALSLGWKVGQGPMTLIADAAANKGNEKKVEVRDCFDNDNPIFYRFVIVF